VVGAQHGRPRDLDQATRHKPDPVLQHGISSSSQYYGLRATTQPNPALLTNYKPRRSKNYFHRDLPHPLHCTCSASTPRGGLGRLPIRGQSRQGDQVVVKLHGHLARLQHGSPKFQIPCFLVNRFSRILLCNFHIPSYSKFPGPLRGSAEGPQTPDSMFPSVQIPGNSSENSTFRVSEFPRHLRCGSAEGPQIPVSKFPSVQIPLSRILLCKKFHIPSFRVSEAGGPLLGPSRRDPQIPDSEFPSLRRPLLGPSRMDRPKSQNPNCKYSPDSELFREEYLRREQIPEYRAQFLFPLLFSGTAHSLPRGLGQMGGTRVGGDGVTWRGEIVTKRTARQNFGLLVISVSTCPPPGPDLDGTHAPPPAPDLTPGRDGHHRHGTVVVAECA